MSEVIISGIQQIGVGVPDVYEAWRWYRKYFGFDVRVFEEAAPANYMLPYTGGKPHERHAALALNLQGGGGFEIWQYTSRTPQPPKNEIKMGDLGHYCAKLRSRDVQATYDHFEKEGLDVVGVPKKDPRGISHFYVRDPFGNIFDIVENKKPWFKDEKKHTGGTFGVTIGCSDIQRSIDFYRDLLGYTDVQYDGEGTYNDLGDVPLAGKKFKRAILSDGGNRQGAFSRMFGESEIELFEVQGRKTEHIFKDRYWGDLGFIHLCFDISGMAELKGLCAEKGYPFTIDSSDVLEGESFDMGEAAGYFSYVEDPAGSWTEFVETHKVPILKKLGIYLNLKKRDPKKPLPDFVVKALGFNRFKG